MKGHGIGGNDEFLIGIEFDELFNILIGLVLVVLSGFQIPMAMTVVSFSRTRSMSCFSL